MITKRTLERWRKEALEFINDIKDMPEAGPIIETHRHILKLTQELLDQQLIRK